MNVKLKETFERRHTNGGLDTCTLEQFDDGSIYVIGDVLGELIVEFASDAYDKAVSQLSDLGYEKLAKADRAKQQAG